MLYYIVLTQVCGLKCIYCQNTPDPRIQPINFSIDLNDLKRFISMDPNPYICFYGGDPLMRIDLVEKIMDEIPAKKYIIQTNAINLNKMKRRYLEHIDTLLVSIDGREEVNDYYRGEGVYKKVLENVRYALDNGFHGDLVARMAVSGKTDIYLDVRHLVELDNPHFDHVHWQLDVLWDFPPAQRYENFDLWMDNIYNPGITRLINYWITNMDKGFLLGIVPFIGIMWSLLTGEKRRYLRCGAGIDAFGITTDGRIMACPIAPEYKFNIIGDIWNSRPSDLPYKAKIGEPCLSCKYYDLCGGRCLFANKTMLWGETGFKKVCKTVYHLIDSLREVEPLVRKYISEDKVALEMFNYPPYPNSIEVIP